MAASDVAASKTTNLSLSIASLLSILNSIALEAATVTGFVWASLLLSSSVGALGVLQSSWQDRSGFQTLPSHYNLLPRYCTHGHSSTSWSLRTAAHHYQKARPGHQPVQQQSR
jgi:hypothetical protein